MSSCADRAPAPARLGLLACALVALAGCSGDFLCRAETCNGRDDDCDDRTDEGFVDARGLYGSVENCGGCGLACAAQFPDALATECVDVEGTPSCRIAACPEGSELVGGGTACAPDPGVLCLSCENHADCERRLAGARCLDSLALQGGRCGQPCLAAADCPDGFRCRQRPGAPDPQCEPVTGSCECSEAMFDTTFGCQLELGEGEVCPGTQSCGPQGLSECAPLTIEGCNALDDDCDGAVDEDFRDAEGRFVSEAHCGGCNQRCSSPGAHAVAVCVADAAGGEGAYCAVGCENGYVDVDGLIATGCECRLVGEVGFVIGGDNDCDGSIDPTPALIFVAQNGDDANGGTAPGAPLRTIQAGLAAGKARGRDVLVAEGLYQGPVDLVAGVTLVGGYRSDFMARDVGLHPVVIEPGAGTSGTPVLRASGVREATVIDGFTVVASDALGAGQGSTALYLDGSGPELRLENLTVIAGRGAAGTAGLGSSDRLASYGYTSLADLTGRSGATGLAGTNALGACPIFPELLAAGAGGARSCSGGLTVHGGAGGPAACPELACDNNSTEPCGNAGCTDYTIGGVCDYDAMLLAAVPNPPAAMGLPLGSGGSAGVVTYNAPTNRGTCSFCDDGPSLPRSGGDGGDGTPGQDGPSGAGCSAAPLFDAAHGWLLAGRGGDGSDGSHGAGGGGGSAGSGFAKIANTMGTCSSQAGGSGGGGGSGGCGAPAASGGSGGGASVGVLVRLAPGVSGPALGSVRVVTASGGDGGAGGLGAAGGPGGAGGAGGTGRHWCAKTGGRGGDGGDGGDGGGGGGGCGGASLGLFVTGAGAGAYAADLDDGLLVEPSGVPGRGGAGGFSPGNSGSDGSDGLVQPVLAIE